MSTGAPVSFYLHKAAVCHEATLDGWHTRVSLHELIDGVMKAGFAQSWEQFGEWPSGQPAPWPDENTGSVLPFGKFCLWESEFGWIRWNQTFAITVYNWEMIRPCERNVNIPVSLLPRMAAWLVWTTCVCNRSAYDPKSHFPLHSECLPNWIFCWTSVWVWVSVSWLFRTKSQQRT